MPATPPRTTPMRRRPALVASDFERHLLAHAATIAPADVAALVGRAGEIRARLTGERAVHPRLANRAAIALSLLGDHTRGACPQIPYQTVALLATALYYYLAPMDVIPDFIPRAGTADDAVVLDVAWEVGGRGIQRYLDATGASTAPLGRPHPTPAKRPRRAARRPAIPRAAKATPKRRS